MHDRFNRLVALSSGLKNGLLTRPLATIVAAGFMSLLTLAASLYLFMFAGQGLLPPPPAASLPATRMLEPVPVGSGSAQAGPVAETPETAAATPIAAVASLFVTAPSTASPAAPPSAPSTQPAATGGTAEAPVLSQYPVAGEKEESSGRSSEHANRASVSGFRSSEKPSDSHSGSRHEARKDQEDKDD